MKKIIYSLFVCLSLVMVSCDESTQDPSFITYYVDFEMNGDEIMTVELGTPYVEPGVIAKEQGKDITSTIVTTGADKVDVSKAGVYFITYSATNVDGYSSEITRMVAVYDPAITTDISGTYSTSLDSNRQMPQTNDEGEDMTDDDGNYVWDTPEPFSSNFSVVIEKIAPGIFHISDMMGGYYDQGRGYGAAYAMPAYVSMKSNTDPAFTIVSGGTSAFGGMYDELSGITYNPDVTPADDIYPGILKWSIEYQGMLFNIVLDKPVE